jgi:hypothetical protein
MQLAAHIRLRIITGFFYAVLLAIAVVVLAASCSDKDASEISNENGVSDSFTFFGLGDNSELTEAVREQLANELGRDAIEYRSILDLETNYPGFLKAHFPHLDQLNQKLNYPPRERVEHNTVKLMYRYAQNKNVPFDYVELVFSNYTRTPILFRIHFKRDESNIINTLKGKYGAPKKIAWNEAGGTSLYWTKANDKLIVSLVPDIYGDLEYQIVIYFTENLNRLIQTEAAAKQAREQQRARSGKGAF